MAFTQKTWKNASAPPVPGVDPALEASELNRIEQGIKDVHTFMDAGTTGSANSNMFFRRDGTLTVLEGTRFRVRYPFTIKELSVDLDIAGGGATLVRVRVYKNGATTSANQSVAAGTLAPTAVTGLSVAFAAGDYISVGVDQQDSNKAAVGMSVTLGVQYA